MDPIIKRILDDEQSRQNEHIELIASENFASQDVMNLCGSIFTNKYAEGRPGARYYSGCEQMDEIETLAEELIKELFECDYANVQPHSGANANLAVFFATLAPGDTILGMRLDHGGHLSHGSPVNISGKWFNAIHYGTDDDGFIDYGELFELAERENPKMIIAGASAYPRQIDWVKFREAADLCGAVLLADVSHYSGLIVGGAYDSPFPYADIVTSTTHKTLRGPRGGVILTNDKGLSKKINKAVFPGTQGGPLMHIIAAKAQCFAEAAKPEFLTYSSQVVANARHMAQTFMSDGIDVVTGGTDSHIVLLDLRKYGLSGKDVADILEQQNITVNANTVPNDPLPPSKGSGIRIGTAAMTTKNWDEEQFGKCAIAIGDCIKS